MGSRRSIEIEGFGHGEQPIPAACRKGNLLITGGVHGLGGAKTDADGQAQMMFKNLGRILEAGGASLDDVVKLTVFVRTREARAAINPEWLKAFPDPATRPARHTIQNDHMPEQLLIQCEAIAFVGD